MPPEELWEQLRKQPFEPFRIYLSDNSAFDVRHPELLMVGRRSAVVGIAPPQQAPPFYDRTTTVALLHIVRLEPIAAASSANN
jgi:hypothetical protein